MTRFFLTAFSASALFMAASTAPTEVMAVNGSESYAPLSERAVSGYRNAAYYVNWYFNFQLQ